MVEDKDMIGQGIWLVLPKGLLELCVLNIPRPSIFIVHLINFCVASSCKLSCVTTMMSHITALSNFFTRETRMFRFSCIVNYPSIRKTKLIPLC